MPRRCPADHMSSLLYEHEMSRDSSLPVISTCWRTGTSRKSPRPNSVPVAFVVTPASPRFLLRPRPDRCFTGTYSLVRKTDIFFLNAALNWKKFILLVSELITFVRIISMSSNVSDGVMSYTRNKFLPCIPR